METTLEVRAGGHELGSSLQARLVVLIGENPPLNFGFSPTLGSG